MKHWDFFWQNNQSLSSFAHGSHQDSYKGDIAKFWADIFALENSSSSLVDLGCGNGVLALMALRSGKFSRVCAIDYADIKPLDTFCSTKQILEELSQIEFYARTKIEDLPFDDSVFELVISQFGFEYADIGESVIEIARVLKPSGRAVFLCHHPESFITISCRETLNIINLILKKNSIVDMFLNFSKKYEGNNLVNTDSRYQDSKNLMSSIIEFRASLGESQSYLFNSLIKPFVQLMSQQNYLKYSQFLNYSKELSFEADRVREQINSVIDENKLNLLKKITRELGIDLKIDEFKIDGKVFAKLIHLKK